jgi:hypothetical protein
VILGNPGFDLIDPKEGNDKICAGGGDDRVIERPGGGTDSIDGESGSDTVALGNGTTPPAGTIDLLAGTGSIPSGTGTTFALDSVENGQGSVQTDTLIGDGGPNELDGGIGNDTLTGGGGADELLGGNDADQIFARDGSPTRSIAERGPTTPRRTGSRWIRSPAAKPLMPSRSPSFCRRVRRRRRRSARSGSAASVRPPRRSARRRSGAER